MKPIFIQLTSKESGKKFKGNICLLQRYGDKKDGGGFVIGWNNNGGIDVIESEKQIDDLIKEALKKSI